MSDQSSPSTPSSAVSVGKKKTNKFRQKARAQFDASAPLIPLERFFSDFQEVRRNNVHVELDPNLLDRVAVPYLDKASDYCDLRMLEETDAKSNLVQSTYALVGFGLIRKLLKSAPASVQPNLPLFKFIADNDYYIPPALATVFDNVGKFSNDQFTVRLEYVEQDILRNVLRTLRGLSLHSQFQSRYVPPSAPFASSRSWEGLDVEKVLFPSISSARWLRDQGRLLLSETAYRTFDARVVVNGVDTTIKATFPQLRICDSRPAQIKALKEWLPLLSPDVPGSTLLAAAAMFQVWTPLYFTKETRPFKEIEPELDGVIKLLSPRDLLTAAGFFTIQMDQRPGTANWIDFMRHAHEYLTGHSRTMFDKFLKLTKQPDTQFGTMAQLLEMDEKAWSTQYGRSVPDFTFRTQRPDMSARCLFKFNEKQLVTSALLFGFSKRVWYENSQSARLNGSIPSTRLSYVSTDFVNFA